MYDEILCEIITKLCNGYINSLLIGIEENKGEFTYLLASVNFISELRQKNIIVEFNDVFNDFIIDKIYYEINKFLAK